MSSTLVTFFMINVLDRMASSTSLIFLHKEKIAIRCAIAISKTASLGVCVSMWCYLKELDKAYL